MAKKRRAARSPQKPLSRALGARVHHLTPQRSTSPREPLTPERVKLHVQKMLLVADLLDIAIGDPELEKAALSAMQVLVNRTEHTLAAVDAVHEDEAETNGHA
jgi:hypothetical protein